VNGVGGVVDGRQAGRQPGPPRVVAVFVPTPIFQEVQAVFQPPMMAYVLEQLGRCDTLRIETRNEIANVVRQHFSAWRTNQAVHAQR
jgi:hypothetical protein